jgi:hypothetical protein
MRPNIAPKSATAEAVSPMPPIPTRSAPQLESDEWKSARTDSGDSEPTTVDPTTVLILSAAHTSNALSPQSKRR